jgi:hypothetical protein
MVKIVIEITQKMYDDLLVVANTNGIVNVTQIIQQEVDNALANADLWMERWDQVMINRENLKSSP